MRNIHQVKTDLIEQTKELEVLKGLISPLNDQLKTTDCFMLLTQLKGLLNDISDLEVSIDHLKQMIQKYEDDLYHANRNWRF